MAQITVDQQFVVVEADDFDQLWRSRLEIPLTQVVRAEVAKNAASGRSWLPVDPDHSSELARPGAFLRNGRDVFCDVRGHEPVVVIHLRDNRYARLVVQVDDPEDSAARIQRAVRRAVQQEQLPANTLAFLLGVLETQESAANMIRCIWEHGNKSRLAPTILPPTEVARGVLGEERFESARAAGRAASTGILATDLKQGSRSGGIRLSCREQEVLALVAEGCSNQAIAETLSISERTARYHVTSIFNKLGADNRAHAVALAAQRGFLAPAA